MNDLPPTGHCTEEQILDLLLHNHSPGIRAHIDACPACSKLLDDYREVQRHLAGLPEEEIPGPLAERILRMTSHGRGGGESARKEGRLGIITTPLLIAVAVLAVVALLYLLVGSAVMKMP
jgi:hypothetical protein